MAFLHRKSLNKSMEYVGAINKSCIVDFTVPLPPKQLTLPPPSPPPITYNRSLSPFLIIMFCGLTVCFSFICYLTFSKICRMCRGNMDHEAHEDIVNEDLGPVMHNPIWLINTIGLDQSQIESIGFFKYKRDEKLIEITDCSVCLSEFEDHESLRLLPKCSHAFHVPCIDTWLQSHKNCPLCRAPIIKNTNDQTEHEMAGSNLMESSTSDESESPVLNESETNENHHVVEVENNEGTAKTSGILEENTVANIQYSTSDNRRRVPSDHLTGQHHVLGDELVLNSHLVGSKKPCSMPKGGHKLKLSSSSSSIQIRGTPMKSSSLGHSQRKASSFNIKCRPHNQSY